MHDKSCYGVGRFFPNTAYTHGWTARTGPVEGLCLDICAGAPKFLVTPLLMGPVCLLSQGMAL